VTQAFSLESVSVFVSVSFFLVFWFFVSVSFFGDSGFFFFLSVSFFGDPRFKITFFCISAF
jgi:hypothetical protein